MKTRLTRLLKQSFDDFWPVASVLLKQFAIVFLFLGVPTAFAQDALVMLRRADGAIGASQVKTLRFEAAGTGATFGQAYEAGQPWPKLNYPSFERLLDYSQDAMRETWARSRAEPNGGGAVPLMGSGEQRATGLLNGNFAWNMVGPAPQASPLAYHARRTDLWTSPHGVIKAAQRRGATAHGEGERAHVAFNEPGCFTAKAWFNTAGEVVRVESVQAHPVMGDLITVTWYSDYRDQGNGVRFPARIRQEQGGWPVLDLTVAKVEINGPGVPEAPALVQAFKENAVAESITPGVWFIGGGSHNSVAIEMSDHLLLVEAPLYDGRSQAVLDALKRLSNKPVRYVVNSHHHFDHAGGLRTAAAAGATLVVSEAARPWFERTLANPNRIGPDALAKSGRNIHLLGVGAKHEFNDGTRKVEIHTFDGSVHARGFLMVYLPAERILIEADAYTPAAPGAAPPAPPNSNHLNLIANVERLNLAVDRIAPLHGRVVPYAELLAAAGRR